MGALSYNYHYTDTEIKKLLASMVVLIDTREQVNKHIITYLDQHKIPYKTKKLDVGDYSALIPKNIELGIYRDMYYPVVIERKNGIDELAQSIKAERFEHELIRSQRVHFTLLIESAYENMVNGNYIAQYAPNALQARLKSFEARYGFASTFLNDKQLTGHFIYTHLYYHVRAMLKG